MLFIYDSQIGMELQFYPSQTKSCIDLFQILFDTPNYQRGWLESLEDKKPWPLMLQFLVARNNMPSLSWRTVSKPYCYIKKDQGYDIFCRQLLSSSACFRKKKDFRRNCIIYMFFKKYIFLEDVQCGRMLNWFTIRIWSVPIYEWVHTSANHTKEWLSQQRTSVFHGEEEENILYLGL